jgi:DNA-binding response OmpR family regulator
MDDKKTNGPVHLRKAGSDRSTGVKDAKVVDFVAPHGVLPSTAQTGADISFGPYTLSLSERLLTREGAPVELGGRAFDLLAALASRLSLSQITSGHIDGAVRPGSDDR